MGNFPAKNMKAQTQVTKVTDLNYENLKVALTTPSQNDKISDIINVEVVTCVTCCAIVLFA